MKQRIESGLFAWLAALALGMPVAAWAEDPQTLKEVVVTGKGVDVAERRESTTQKVILGRKEIENLGVMTIGEVLGKLPGVEMGSMSGGMRARGMSRDSVQLLVDGERSAGGGGMAGIIGRLPSGDLERVEILRGSSAEYGGSAPVTVNLVMKKTVPKKSVEVRAGAGLRGSEPSGQLAFTKNGGEGGFSWTLPVALLWNNSPVERTADRQVPGGALSHTAEHEQGINKLGHHSITPRMTWKDGSDSLTLAPMLFFGPQTSSSDTALTDYTSSAAGTPNGRRSSKQDSMMHVARFRAEGEKHVDGAKLTGRTAFSRLHNTTDVVRNTYDAANALSSSTADHTDNVENEFNFALRLDKPFGDHLLAVGVEHIGLHRTQDQNLSGSLASYLAQERQSTAWVQDDWALPNKVTLTYGLRGESVALNASNASQQRGRAMPSLAVRWEPVEKWVMRSSLGAGMKMPKLDEISDALTPSVGVNTPLEANKRGNPNLRPERSVNFEAVLERYLDGEAGVFGANLYARSTQDFTERRVQQEGSAWVDRPQNEGRALHWGWELDGKVRTDNLGWKGATVKAHLTLPHARVEDARLGITRMARDTPKYVMSAGLDESLPALQSSYGISLQLSGRSVTDIPGEQYVVAQARTTLDAFWLYMLNAQFKLRISGQNLLGTDTVRDMRYTSGGNAWQLHTVEGGYRTVMATLEGRW